MNCRYLLFFLLLFLTQACVQENDPIQERIERAENGKGDIIIGAAAPLAAYKGIWEGLEMAVDELNSKGGVLGRKIKIIKEDDESSVSKGQQIAQKFADNLDMVAVIGHYNSHISIPNSIIYEYNGLLMLSPYSSSPRLTKQGFKRVFRNTLSDSTWGEALAKFSQKQRYKKIAIYHVKNEYGTGLSNAFEKYCKEQGITIVDRLSYDSFSGEKEFRKDLKNWKKMYKFDAIFVAGTMPGAAIFVKEVRNQGLQVPIIGGAGLDFQKFLDIAGTAANGTYIGAIFHFADPRKEIQDFVHKFKQKYNMVPNTCAAQGYDSILVLAKAMEKAGTTIPDRVADSLRSMNGWDGIIMKSSFDDNGDIQNAEAAIKVVKNGKFEFYLSK